MISAFGVEHGDEFSKAEKKKQWSPEAKAAVAGGVIGATVLSRRQSNRLGTLTARRTVGRGDWAMERAGEMRSSTGAELRRGYARKLQGAGIRMNRSADTREITGRVAAAGGVGAGAAAVSHLNRRAKENQ